MSALYSKHVTRHRSLCAEPTSAVYGYSQSLAKSLWVHLVSFKEHLWGYINTCRVYIQEHRCEKNKSLCCKVLITLPHPETAVCSATAGDGDMQDRQQQVMDSDLKRL
jgi:hypothetical protein